MQTFLPYPDFYASAKVLDRQRLGKQRVEVLQILRTVSGESQGWRHHPAVKMWAGYEQTLVAYGIAVCAEWQARDYRDTCLDKIAAYRKAEQPKEPWWLGDDRLHRSHQSNLIRKSEHYARIFPDVPNNLPYWWPNNEKESV